MGRLGLLVAVALGLCLPGCVAATRVARMGPLPGDHSLVTLVVSEDREVVTQECAKVPAAGPLLGCQMSWSVPGPSVLPVRVVKIVRYTDSLPSPLAFEIDVHELCHAIAALQILDDPCHKGNGGVAQTEMARAETAPDRRASAGIRSTATTSPALAIPPETGAARSETGATRTETNPARSETGHGGNPTTAEPAEFEFGRQPAASVVTEVRDGLKQVAVLAPDRTGADGVGQGSVPLTDRLPEPDAPRIEPLAQPRIAPEAATAGLVAEHLDEVAVAGDEFAEPRGMVIAEGSRGGADGFGGDGDGIEDDRRGREPLEASHQGGQPGVIVRETDGLTAKADADLEAVSGNVEAAEARIIHPAL